MRTWWRYRTVWVGVVLVGVALSSAPGWAQPGAAARAGTAAVAPRQSSSQRSLPPSGPASARRPASASGDVLHQAADLVEWGRLKRARELLAAALAQPANTNNAPLIAYDAHVLLKFGQVDEGLALTQRALAVDEDCASCHLYRFEALADHAKTMSRIRAMMQLSKMKKELETAYRINPGLGDIQWGWVELYLNLPAALGGPDKAREHAEKLVLIDPVDGHLALAAIAKDANQPEQALAEYRAAAQANSQDPRGIFALGQALYQHGDYRSAAVNLSRALALNPNSALYSAYQAANLVHLHELDAAHRVVVAGHGAHPDSRLGDYLVAKALKETGVDFAWARQLLGAYLNIPPEPDQPTLAQARSLLAALS